MQNKKMQCLEKGEFALGNCGYLNKVKGAQKGIGSWAAISIVYQIMSNDLKSYTDRTKSLKAGYG